jgi:molecular chaperone DnaK (HSP70)
MARYALGIDLGTTNCALASVELTKKKADVQIFQTPQLVAAGEVAVRPLLPSFLFLPGSDQLPSGAAALPWDPSRSYVVGQWARDLGGQIPGRLVASAKSWLCHDRVDRTAALLPWGAAGEVPRISAITASTRYLQHLKEAWNEAHRHDKPPVRLEDQEVTLTVPASFDDVARQLTAEAARQAGLHHVTLLEEPQAAFYAWIAQADRDRRRKQPLRDGMTCLVVDVGGGTTDFSLIRCVAQEGSLGFVRQAVGDHLLLGGDNMDLALAHRIEEKYQTGKLDAARFATLAQACRAAKEQLLGDAAPAQVPVTIMGRGRSVVAGALSAPLTRQEVLETLDRFFPEIPFTGDPSAPRPSATGLHDLGLPFVSDPAITRHLAEFLRHHGISAEQPPAAVLFNGGVFTPAFIRNRLVQVLQKWFSRPERPWEPILLSTPSLDLAVAWGAAYYGRMRQVGGRRIAGGLARSYYIAVAGGSQGQDHQQMLCVVPQHLEEGQTIQLQEPILELALGQPVQFPLYTSTVREQDQAGQTLSIPPQELLKLAPLQTLLHGGKRAGTRGVPVILSSTLTEIGTLEISLLAQNSPNRWKLEFNTRDAVSQDSGPRGDPATASMVVSGSDDADPEAIPPETAEQSTAKPPEIIFPQEKIEAATDALRSTYENNAEEPARQLSKTWERLLEASRRDWPMGLCRQLVDGLLAVAEERRRSPAHLSRWYHLTGYCLRPGYGEARDRFRLDQLWKQLCAPARQSGPTGGLPRQIEGGADYWILWRRLSGGLPANLQLTLFDRLRPILLPAKAKGPSFKPNANELAEMWRAAASLERLEPKWKEGLAQPLIKLYRRPPVPPYAPWALARLGARALLEAPLNYLVHAETVMHWIEALLPYQPSHESDSRSWLWTLTTMTRKTGLRGIDVDETLRQRVIQALQHHHAPRRFIHLVAQGGELEQEERQQLFGDELPLGLRLLQDSGEEPRRNDRPNKD